VWRRARRRGSPRITPASRASFAIWRQVAPITIPRNVKITANRAQATTS
jgi:hypothetical protein